MDITKYTNKLKYPSVLRKPYLKPDHTSEEAYQYSKNLKEYEEYYREERQKYRDEDNRLIALFKQDAFKELGVANHPKRDKLWDMAWEEGHDNGFAGVWYRLEELIELMV